jgi:hypothetical protein
MNREIKTIDIGSMHPIRAEKIIKHMVKNRTFKDFPEPTFFEKAKYYATEIMFCVIISLAINMPALMQMLQ